MLPIVISHSQVLPPMKTTVVSHQSGTVRLQIDIDISGSMLAVSGCCDCAQHDGWEQRDRGAQHDVAVFTA